MIDINKLKNDVIMTFSTLSYPEGEIFPLNVPIHTEFKDIFKNKLLWTSLTDEQIRYYAHELFFFTPQGFVYYLPAFLMKALEGNNTIAEELYATLSPIFYKSPNKQWLDVRVKHLTLEQKKVVYDYMLWCNQEPDLFLMRESSLALEYWKTHVADI